MSVVREHYICTNCKLIQILNSRHLPRDAKVEKKLMVLRIRITCLACEKRGSFSSSGCKITEKEGSVFEHWVVRYTVMAVFQDCPISLALCIRSISFSVEKRVLEYDLLRRVICKANTL